MPQVLNCWQLSIQFNLIFNRPCGFNCTSCRIVHPGVHRFLRLFLSVTSSQVASPSIRQLRYSSGIRAIKGEREVPTGQCLFSQSACVCSLPSFGYLSVLLDNYFLLKNLARHGAPTYNPSRQEAEAIEWQVSTSILCLNSTSAFGFADTEAVLSVFLPWAQNTCHFCVFSSKHSYQFFCDFGYCLKQSLNLLVYPDTSPSATCQQNSTNSHWFIPQWMSKLHGPTPFRKYFHRLGATWAQPPGVFLCFLSLPSNWLCWCYGSNQPRLTSPQVSELFIMFSMCSQHTSSKT